MEYIEIILLGLTAIITLFAALYVGRQTHHHFKLQRSTHFIERFNSGELHQMRIRVDEFIRQQPNWETHLRGMREGTLSPEQRSLLYDVRVFANFFQELSTALQHDTLSKAYIWDVFGGLVKRYWKELQPYIEVTRKLDQRPTLFCDFEALANEMEKIDAKKCG